MRQTFGYSQRDYRGQEDFQDNPGANTYRGREKTSAIDVRGEGPLVKKKVLDHFGQYGNITDISLQSGARSAVITYAQPVICAGK